MFRISSISFKIIAPVVIGSSILAQSYAFPQKMTIFCDSPKSLTQNLISETNSKSSQIRDEPIISASSINSDQVSRDYLILRSRLDNPSEFENLTKLLKHPKFDQFLTNHVLHGEGPLAGKGKIECYEIYRKIGSDELEVLIKFGDSLNGHVGVVHGGVSALLIDNTFGWLFIALGLPPAVTANLTVNYRRPVFAGTVAVLRASLSSFEGRKMKMNATLETAQGEVLVECSSLFITVNKL